MTAAARAALTVPHSIDLVWRAWTEPAWLTGWQVESIDGEIAAGRSVRVGWASLGLEIDLEIATCEPQAHLVLRGAPPGRPPQTQTVSLAPARDGGGTLVEVVHDGFAAGAAGDEERAGTADGWHTLLRVLRHYLDHHAGAPRECAAALTPVAAAPAELEPALFGEAGLASWLGAGSPAPSGEGSRFALDFPDGLRWGGTVLASAPPHQHALSVTGFGGVAVLRAIQLAPGSALVGVQAWSWTPRQPGWAAARSALERAVARLAAATAPPGASA